MQLGTNPPGPDLRTEQQIRMAQNFKEKCKHLNYIQIILLKKRAPIAPGQNPDHCTVFNAVAGQHKILS